MRKYLALLCYRVARWLAPDYFCNRLQSLQEIRIRIGVLRERICQLPKKRLCGREGRFIISELHSLESIYKSTAAYNVQYELVKIEIAQPSILGPIVPHEYTSPEDHFKGECKKQLFAALAGGLAKSAEIEKFMYFREYGNFKTVGIELYLKHDK